MLNGVLTRFWYWLSAVQLALRALARWPLRASLTAFGIMVGILAVTVTIALGEGARSKVKSQVDSLGSNAYLVQPEGLLRGGVMTGDVAHLSQADGEAIARDVSGIRYVAPIVSVRETLAFGASNTNAEVLGTTAAYFAVRNWGVSLGALWDEAQENAGAPVCLLGQTVRQDLFGSEDPVGRTVRVGRTPLRVIGVLAAKGQDAFGRDEDARILVPIRVARAKARGAAVGRVDSLVLGARDGVAPERVQAEVVSALRAAHHLAEDVQNDFVVRSQAEFRAVQDRILGVLNSLLVSVAAVSLVVGGIGIMNIMLVSVSERTREIGVRLAVGASERDVLVQFLVEAVVVSLLGGLLGALGAAALVAVLGDRLGFALTLSGKALGLSMLVSCGVGVLFGYVPARRAARLDPIEALRGE